jgi:hypothetical protein
MLTFSKAQSLVFEASTLEGIHKGGVLSSCLGGVSPSFAEVVRGKTVSLVKHPRLQVSELELRVLDLLPEAWCGVVEDRRMAVNCYDLGEQPHGSTEKNTNLVCFHGGGVARKKKVGLFRSWMKLLEWLWAALDWVSTSRFKCVGLGLKPKQGNRAGTKAMVKYNTPGVGSSSVDFVPGFLGCFASSKPSFVLAQSEASSVAFPAVFEDFAIQQLGSSQRLVSPTNSRFSLSLSLSPPPPPRVARGAIFGAGTGK